MALDGGVAAAKKQLADPFIGYQHLVAAALALQSAALDRLGVDVANQAEVQLPGAGRELAQGETEPDVFTVSRRSIWVWIKEVWTWVFL